MFSVHRPDRDLRSERRSVCRHYRVSTGKHTTDGTGFRSLVRIPEDYAPGFPTDTAWHSLWYADNIRPKSGDRWEEIIGNRTLEGSSDPHSPIAPTRDANRSSVGIVGEDYPRPSDFAPPIASSPPNPAQRRCSPGVPEFPVTARTIWWPASRKALRSELVRAVGFTFVGEGAGSNSLSRGRALARIRPCCSSPVSGRALVRARR